MTHKAVPE